MARAILRTMRPRQFMKNGVVFLALVFTVGRAWQPGTNGTWLPLLLRSSLAFVAFSAVAAGEYLVNDAADAESDRKHPQKRFRPVASGELPPRLARLVAAETIASGLILGVTLGQGFSTVLGIYAGLMLAYTSVLKHVVLIDILAIATGFVLRAIAGALAIDVRVSPWLYICTILGALLLAVTKRRHELLLMENGAAASRPSLARYSVQMLTRLSAIVAAATVVVYALYTVTAEGLPHNHVMVVTVPFVLFGVLRYLQLVQRRGAEGAPDEVIVRDGLLLGCFVLWMGTAGILLAAYR